MLYILTGGDHFAQQAFVADLAVKTGGAITRLQADTLPPLETLFTPNLFAQKSITVLVDCLDKPELLDAIDRLKQSKDVFVCVQTKIDKRKSTTQSLLKDKDSTVQDFPAPTSANLSSWIMHHAQQQGIAIDSKAVERLTSLLAGTPRPFGDSASVDVWQIHNELLKLATYADSAAITETMVAELVTPTAEPEIWDIINALSTKKPALVLARLQAFLDHDQSSDDKAKVIQLNALLADQCRNLLLVKSADASGMPDSVVLQRTGWKPGRLTVLKKASNGFSEKSLLSLLQKLEALDVELKTSSVPPRVLIDMICAQIN